MGVVLQTMWMVDDTIPWALPLFFGLFGAIAGSFLNCALYRVPAQISLWGRPSHCPHCQTKLGAISLIPVLSWVVLKGRCRTCKTPIGQRYLWVEVVTTITAACLPVFLPVNLNLFIYFIILILVLFFGFLWLLPKK